MVTRGSVRGNGKALAYYLTTKADNERIEILDIDGREGGNRNDLVHQLTSWSLMSELTKSDKGLYHAVLNPAYGDDRKMAPEDWKRAADILAKETGFEGQRRAIVLHEKQGRIHGHIVYERYDHERGIMVSDSFLRLAQDRARKTMEIEFGHQITPDRNKRKNELKSRITGLWQASDTGQAFVAACSLNGYAVTRTAQRRSFSVVDDEGISYDLTRQIKGVKAKEVAQRLEGVKLQSDREAIKAIRQKQAQPTNDQELKKQGRNNEAGEDNTKRLAYAFAQNRNDMLATGTGSGGGNEKEDTMPPDDPPPTIPARVEVQDNDSSADDKERKKQEIRERLRQQMEAAKESNKEKHHSR
jgi:hypothetical protein